MDRPFQWYIACGKFPLATGLNSWFYVNYTKHTKIKNTRVICNIESWNKTHSVCIEQTFPMICRMRQVSTRNGSKFLFYVKPNVCILVNYTYNQEFRPIMGRNLPHAIYHWKGIEKTFPTIYRMRQVITHNGSEFLFYVIKKCLYSHKLHIRSRIDTHYG